MDALTQLIFETEERVDSLDQYIKRSMNKLSIDTAEIEKRKDLLNKKSQELNLRLFDILMSR